MRKSVIWKMIMMGVVALALVGCSGKAPENEGQDNATKENSNDETARTELEGSVVSDDPGTAYPLMAKLADEYMVNEEESVAVAGSGAGKSAGFEKFLLDH